MTDSTAQVEAQCRLCASCKCCLRCGTSWNNLSLRSSLTSPIEGSAYEYRESKGLPCAEHTARRPRPSRSITSSIACQILQRPGVVDMSNFRLTSTLPLATWTSSCAMHRLCTGQVDGPACPLAIALLPTCCTGICETNIPVQIFCRQSIVVECPDVTLTYAASDTSVREDSSSYKGDTRVRRTSALIYVLFPHLIVLRRTPHDQTKPRGLRPPRPHRG
jgi:hypothetical protein